MTAFSVGRKQPSDVVTPSECAVLTSFSHGMDSEATGELLGISHHTVQTHYQKAKRKLRAKTRTHAVALAIRQGII